MPKTRQRLFPQTDLPRRRRRRPEVLPVTGFLDLAPDADELIETTLQCLLAARQEIDGVADGDAEALAALRAIVDEALLSAYRIRT